MKNNSFFKKLSIFRDYKKTIRSIKSELFSKFNIKVDRAYRLYTVINIPRDLIGEAYDLKKSDIDRIADTYIKEFNSDLSKFLISKNLMELISFYSIEKVDKYSYLLIYGYSLFDSGRYYTNLWYKFLPAVVVTTILGLVLSYLIF